MVKFQHLKLNALFYDVIKAENWFIISKTNLLLHVQFD